MKHRIITILFLSALIYTLFSSNSAGRASTGIGFGNTGAPGDETIGGQLRTCQGCHNGPIQMNQTISIFALGTQTPVTAYVPGTTYDVVVVNNVLSGSPTGYGYQILCLKSGNLDVAAWSNPASNVKIRTAGANGRSYAEHNGVTNNNTFRVSWTAPAAGTGTVTFYTSGTAVNGNGANTGDGANRVQLQLPEGNGVGLENVAAQTLGLTCFPNPVAEQATLRAEGFQAGEYQLVVADLMGRVLVSEQVQVAGDAQSLPLSVGQLAAGQYVVRLSAPGVSKTTYFSKR